MHKFLALSHPLLQGPSRTASLARDDRGAIAVIAALLFTFLIGMAGLATEYGYALVMKQQNQRTADLASVAGALAYKSLGTTTALTAAVANLTALNGIVSSAASHSLTTSPSGDGNSAVQVVVSTSNALVLTTLVGSANSVVVGSGAYAEIPPPNTGGACMLALAGSGAGITLTGGTKVNAASCTISSNASMSVPCGTSITTATAIYNTTAPSEPCSGIQAPSGQSLTLKKAVTADPFASSANITGATARLATVSAMSAPAAPSVSGGTALSFPYGASLPITLALATAGCTGTFNNGTWTVTCVPGTHTFGALSVSGGVSVLFDTAGTSSTYNFNGAVSSSGSALSFGSGTFNIAGGLTTSGGSTTRFGGGTFNIGRASTSCNGGGDYSICNNSSLTFSGPVTMQLQGGIYNGSGSTLTLGTGSSNSYQIGSSSDGHALFTAGGSTTTFSNATGASSVFQATGVVQSSGGSCLTLPAAAQVDINGTMLTAGGVIMGSGVYTVTGYVGIGLDQYGNQEGGDVWCSGADVGVSASGVTLVIGAATTPTSGTCMGAAFCVGAGYSNVAITAPTSGATENLAVIGPTGAGATAGMTFSEGGSATAVSGVFYFPDGPLVMSGGSSIGGAAGTCLQLVASTLTLGGGTAATTVCQGTSANYGVTSAGVKLVQ